MAKKGVFIRDVHSLEQLDDKFGATGKAMANIDQDVISCLQDVKQTLDKQLDYIHTRLGEAENKLSQAKSALEACQSAEAMAAAVGIPGTGCILEAGMVAEAQAEVTKWEMRYRQGQQIVAECQREIGEYNGPGGGHSLIQKMSETQTPKASELLRGCIDKLQDVLASSMVASTDVSGNDVPTTAESSQSDNPRTNDLKKFFRV